MKILRAYTMIVIAFLSGCTHSHTISRNELRSSLKIDKGRRANDVFVFMSNGSTMEADNIVISIDSTRWKDPYTSKHIVIATSEISSVYYVDRWTGLIEGAKFGLLVGGTVGAISGYQLAKSLGVDEHALSSSVMTAFYLGFWGTAVCLPTGFVFGRKVMYHIDPEVFVQEEKLESLD